MHVELEIAADPEPMLLGKLPDAAQEMSTMQGSFDYVAARGANGNFVQDDSEW
jgi:hypothetical protein